MKIYRGFLWGCLGLSLIGAIWLMPTAWAASKAPFRVGYVPLLPQLPLVISYEEDRPKLTQADLKLVKYNSFTAVEAALRVSAIDAAYIPVPIALSIMADEAMEIKIMGACHRGGARLVTRSPGSLDKLRGKLIGVPGLDSCENFKLAEVLGQLKLQAGSDFKVIDIPFASAIKDLQNNKVDALYLPEPYGTIAEHNKVATSPEGDQSRLLGNLTTVLVVRAELLNRNLAAVQEWLQSVGKATNFIENDVAKGGARQTAIIQSKYFEFPNEIVITSLAKRHGNLTFSLFAPNQDEINAILETTIQLRLINKSVDLNKIIFFDLVKRITG